MAVGRAGEPAGSEAAIVGSTGVRALRPVVADARLELVAQLDGPPERGPDGLGQDGPEAARLELVERRRAASRRAR